MTLIIGAERIVAVIIKSSNGEVMGRQSISFSIVGRHYKTKPFNIEIDKTGTIYEMIFVDDDGKELLSANSIDHFDFTPDFTQYVCEGWSIHFGDGIRLS